MIFVYTTFLDKFRVCVCVCVCVCTLAIAVFCDLCGLFYLSSVGVSPATISTLQTMHQPLSYP